MPAAFPRKSSPSRTYRESMASEACPVCCLILNVETPARVALVAKPARRLWPEYPVGSKPAAAIRSRTIKDTASPESRRDRDPPVSIDGPENGTVLDPCGVEPGFQRPDGTVNGSAGRDADLAPDAVLVSLRPPDGQNDPLPDPLDVNEVSCSKLGTPEAACKSDQQQCPISQVLEPIAHRPDNDEEVLTEEWLGLMLSRSVSAANAAHRRPDQRTSPQGLGDPWPRARSRSRPDVE